MTPRGPRVAFFSSASSGGGHLMRGVALARALRRCQVQTDFRVFSPALPYPVARGAYEAVNIDRIALRTARGAERSEVAERLVAFDPDLVIIDVFWAALRHVLPLLRARAWLLLRNVPADWLSPRHEVGLDRTLVDRVLAIERCVDAPVDETIPPIVVSEPDEMRSRDALGEALAMEPPFTLVVSTGSPEERAVLEADAQRFSLPHRTVDLRDDDAPFPLAPWLGGAAHVVGAAGYNLTWELARAELLARAHLVPFARGYEDQRARLDAARAESSRANGADVLARRIAAL